MARPEEEFARAGRDGREFRAAPFWSWNDDLEPEEVRRQVREMKRGGLGGHFMHSRPGLITPYMGRKWMECVRAAVEESKKVGVDAWLYDEDGWPSGFAGGKVPALGPEYGAKRIVVEESTPAQFKPKAASLAVFLGRKKGRKVENARRVAAQEAKRLAAPGETVFCFSSVRSGTWRNIDYVDVLSAKVTDAFLRFGYTPYDREVGKEYGKTVPGIFTDEPTCSCPPWTSGLPATFARLWGYDITENLLSLFYETGDWQQVRHDFWHTVTHLFVNNFTRRLYNWCERRGVALTGHMMAENSLHSQISATGATMPHYRWMQRPGVDHLGRGITDPLLNKQCSSVAHQLGRKQVISESFGMSGWNMSFEDMKWVWDWQSVQGVNFLCQHLSSYSLKGLRKRDYPPCLFYQQPWWGDYGLFNDYVARLGTALTLGRPVADILVIHPVESAWAVFHRQEQEATSALNASLVALSRALMENQRDFDFGDESLLAEFGKVTNGALQVGECAYSAVVIPSSITLRKTTVELLARFVAGGGKVVFTGRIPERVDGRSSPSIKTRLLPGALALAEGDVSGLLQLLDKWLPRRFSLQAKGANIYACERRLEDGRRMWFLNNLERWQGASATLSITGSGSLQEWDLQTGEIRNLPVQKSQAGLKVNLAFARAGSHLLVFDPTGRPLTRKPAVGKVLRRQTLAKEWKLRRTEPNLLTLDHCRYRVNGGRWSKLTPTIHVNPAVHRLQAGALLELRYSFMVSGAEPFRADFDLSSGKPLFLLLERPELYHIRVNGKAVSNPPEADWWCDISFRKVDITGALKAGENVVELRARLPKAPEVKFYSHGMAGAGAGARNPSALEVESCYLLGEFAVSKVKAATDSSPAVFALQTATKTAKTGDLVSQGFPFYRGGVVYSQEIESDLARGEKAWLELAGLEGIVCKVKVNGKKAGSIIWQPWKVEITDLLKKGKNRVDIEVVGSCRNMLGPHHHPDGELLGVSSASFRGKSIWENGREVRLEWSHDYCFVPFGLTGPVKIVYTTRG